MKCRSIYKIIATSFVLICAIFVVYANNDNDIIIENESFILTIGKNAEAKSLLLKSFGKEVLMSGTGIKAFTVTQERPYNNELKLAYPNKKNTYRADTVFWQDDNNLVVGFELVPYQAIISVDISPQYIRFSLKDFIIESNAYPSYMKITPPPATEVCLLQLPIIKRANFGEWLNVVWDDDVAVNILSTDEYTQIDSEEQQEYYILKASVVKDIKFFDTGAALIACATNHLLENIAQIEEDFNLPKGVESRKNKLINASYYWAADLNPTTLERHLQYAKMGGFRLMLIYFSSFEDQLGLRKIGNYEYNKKFFPNGKQDLESMLNRIKEEGIIPGVHFLHSNIGLSSKYVTPVPDYRLNILKSFNLSRPIGEKDSIIYVDQNPEGITMAEGCRILKAGTELISYESYTTSPPYMFLGCKRGVERTTVNSLNIGSPIGLLDISEFGANSVYIDQRTSLQDEVAEKIADIYDAGFEFIYFDGAEGVNPPFNFTIPLAKYRVFKRLKPNPIFAEGAAKSHFSWHMLSGGNAFDTFPPEKVKYSIAKYPAEQAPRMRKDFTRINFGWLNYILPSNNTIGTQPDILEYATSRAASWECPISLQSNLQRLADHPRTKDNLEVIKRWEKVRSENWLSNEHIEMLKDLTQEHHLLINENGEFELVPVFQINNIADNNRDIRAFMFNRKGHWYVLFWHISGESKLLLDVKKSEVKLYKEFNVVETIDMAHDQIILPVSDRRYLKFENKSRDEIVKLFKSGVVI